MADSQEMKQDMKAAEKTYSGFISLLKYSAPAIAVLVLIIIMIIA